MEKRIFISFAYHYVSNKFYCLLITCVIFVLVFLCIDCAIPWYKNACIKTLIIEMEGQLTTQGCPLPHFVHFFLHTVLSSFFQYSSMQINPTVYSLHLIINEKKGMECLTNMKKELMRN